MTRETWFNIGSGTDLTDGKDSPVRDGSWTNSMTIEKQNMFIYTIMTEIIAKLK
jgi:hypothetical protein